MYNIAIVDDEWDSIEHLERCLNVYCEEFKISFSISRFTRGFELLDSFKCKYDIIFLDVDMPVINGIEIAKKIREFDKKVVIIFVSLFPKFALKGYEVSALDYIVKPVEYNHLKLKLQRAISVVNLNNMDVLCFKTLNGFVRIPKNTICFIEISSHKITIHTFNEEYFCYGTMKQMCNMIGTEEFILCNSCYLVNLRAIEKVEGNNLYINGSVLLISRPKKKALISRLKEML